MRSNTTGLAAPVPAMVCCCPSNGTSSWCCLPMDGSQEGCSCISDGSGGCTSKPAVSCAAAEADRGYRSELPSVSACMSRSPCGASRLHLSAVCRAADRVHTPVKFCLAEGEAAIPVEFAALVWTLDMLGSAPCSGPRHDTSTTAAPCCEGRGCRLLSGEADAPSISQSSSSSASGSRRELARDLPEESKFGCMCATGRCGLCSITVKDSCSVSVRAAV